ncbi:magnesium transporter NIPA [Toxoplasma gondii VAND]|uniref:Magnesium transporter NIPA n=1 Tax=Toxoplasma gondii VAND TaxID=933077 RepID=A0A086PH44_TOXGO|nr:magnesium transporter NIPA [Toxoplasma gondii VAND]
MGLSGGGGAPTPLWQGGAVHNVLALGEEDQHDKSVRRKRRAESPRIRQLRRHQKQQDYSMVQQSAVFDPQHVQELNAAMSVSTVGIADRKIHALSTLWKALESYAKRVPRAKLIQKLLNNGAPQTAGVTPSDRGSLARPSNSFLTSKVGELKSAGGDGMLAQAHFSGGTSGTSNSLAVRDSETHGLAAGKGAGAGRVAIEMAEHLGQNFVPIQYGASGNFFSSRVRRPRYGRVERVTGHRTWVDQTAADSSPQTLASNPSRSLMPSSGTLSGLTLTALISKNNLWWAGIICAAVAALAGALGDCVLRYSFVKEREARESTQAGSANQGVPRPLHMRPLWIVGMFLSVVINPFLTLVSYRFAAVSVVAMFGGLHTLGSLVFARILLSEKLGWRDVVGGLLIVSGITEVVIFGHNTTDIKEFIVNGVAFIVFCSVTFAAILLAAVVSHKMVYSTKFPLIAVSMCTALLPGLFGAISNVCGKGAVVLWTDAFQDTKLWTLPYTWIFAAFAAAAALGQVVYLSFSLSRYPASFVGPVYNGILICMNSVGGIWVFSEYTNSLPLFLLGVASTSAGILISAHSQVMKQNATEPPVEGREASLLIESDEENLQLAPDEMEY